MFSGTTITDPSDQTVLNVGQVYWFTFYSSTTLSPINDQVLALLNQALGGIATITYAAAPQSGNYIYFGLMPTSVSSGTTVEGWVLALTSIFQSQAGTLGALWSNFSDAYFVSVSTDAPTPYPNPITDISQSISKQMADF